VYHNITLKDLVAISQRIDICTIKDLYKVSVLTNQLEGEINALVEFTSTEDKTLGRVALFSFRSGEQVCLSDLSPSEQLIIPDDYFARFKESLSVRFNVLGTAQSIWQKTIDNVNVKHITDSNKNFQPISKDLSIPEFKYIVEEKKEDKKKPSFFSRLFKKTKKN